MNDLAKIETFRRQGPKISGSYWASLLRMAAPSVAFIPALENKAEAERDIAAIINDIQQAMNIWQPQAVALMACFIDQDKSSSARLCGVASRGGETPAEERVSAR